MSIGSHENSFNFKWRCHAAFCDSCHSPFLPTVHEGANSYILTGAYLFYRCHPVGCEANGSCCLWMFQSLLTAFWWAIEDLWEASFPLQLTKAFFFFSSENCKEHQKHQQTGKVWVRREKKKWNRSFKELLRFSSSDLWSSVGLNMDLVPGRFSNILLLA